MVVDFHSSADEHYAYQNQKHGKTSFFKANYVWKFVIII